MSSIATFVRKARREFKARPMLPFGAPFEIGIVGVIEDDQFSRRGTVESILRTNLGKTVTAQKPSNWQGTSGRDVKLNFLADGEASTLFPAAPKANAKIEVSFARKESFLVSLKSLTITTLRDPAALIEKLLDAYRRGVWRKEYVLIYETIAPAEVLVLLSKNAGTNLLLGARATVTPQGLSDIAGKFEIRYQTQDVYRLDSGGQPLFYNCYRVKRSFWSGRLSVKPLAAGDSTRGVFERV